MTRTLVCKIIRGEGDTYGSRSRNGGGWGLWRAAAAPWHGRAEAYKEQDQRGRLLAGRVPDGDRRRAPECRPRRRRLTNERASGLPR